MGWGHTGGVGCSTGPADTVWGGVTQVEWGAQQVLQTLHGVGSHRWSGVLNRSCRHCMGWGHTGGVGCSTGPAGTVWGGVTPVEWGAQQVLQAGGGHIGGITLHGVGSHRWSGVLNRSCRHCMGWGHTGGVGCSTGPAGTAWGGVTQVEWGAQQAVWGGVTQVEWGAQQVLQTLYGVGSHRWSGVLNRSCRHCMGWGHTGGVGVSCRHCMGWGHTGAADTVDRCPADTVWGGVTQVEWGAQQVLQTLHGVGSHRWSGVLNRSCRHCMGWGHTGGVGCSTGPADTVWGGVTQVEWGAQQVLQTLYGVGSHRWSGVLNRSCRHCMGWGHTGGVGCSTGPGADTVWGGVTQVEWGAQQVLQTLHGVGSHRWSGVLNRSCRHCMGWGHTGGVGCSTGPADTVWGGVTQVEWGAQQVLQTLYGVGSHRWSGVLNRSCRHCMGWGHTGGVGCSTGPAGTVWGGVTQVEWGAQQVLQTLYGVGSHRWSGVLNRSCRHCMGWGHTGGVGCSTGPAGTAWGGVTQVEWGAQQVLQALYGVGSHRWSGVLNRSCRHCMGWGHTGGVGCSTGPAGTAWGGVTQVEWGCSTGPADTVWGGVTQVEWGAQQVPQALYGVGSHMLKRTQVEWGAQQVLQTVCM